MMLPLSVARITVVNLLLSSCFVALLQRHGVANAGCQATGRRAAERTSRYSITPRLTTNCSVFWPMLSARVATSWLACTETVDSLCLQRGDTGQLHASSQPTAQAGMAAITCWT